MPAFCREQRPSYSLILGKKVMGCLGALWSIGDVWTSGALGLLCSPGGRLGILETSGHGLIFSLFSGSSALCQHLVMFLSCV